ncbi:MAG: methionyl-tRNA formyltransferase [Acidobacteriota bacterium]
MRVVFMGTPETAVPPLKKVIDHAYNVVAVFTQPDRPSGRGQKNGQILPEWILTAARLVPLNIHYSLLPSYRGAAPVARSIMNGDPVTGVTIMVMQESLDSGPIIKQRKLEIPITATTGDIEAELSGIGAELLIEIMDDYKNGVVETIKQDEESVTWAQRISKEEARIKWDETATQIHNRIRALNPRPGAFTFFKGQKLHIWKSIPENPAARVAGIPGAFLGLQGDRMRILCGEGSVLQILELQKPSKNRINGREFINGARLEKTALPFEN